MICVYIFAYLETTLHIRSSLTGNFSIQPTAPSTPLQHIQASKTMVQRSIAVASVAEPLLPTLTNSIELKSLAISLKPTEMPGKHKDRHGDCGKLSKKCLYE